jgi:hypothetical protein
VGRDTQQHQRDRLGEVQRVGGASHDLVGAADVGVQVGRRARGSRLGDRVADEVEQGRWSVATTGYPAAANAPNW